MTNSRFTLMDNPDQAPGACWVSGKTSGKVVDTGVFVRFAQTGRLYLSVEVIRELAEVAGLLDGSVLSSDTSRLHGEQRYNEGYMRAVEENAGGDLRDLVAAFSSAVDRLSGGPVVADDAGSEAGAGEQSADVGQIDIFESIPGEPDDDGSPIVVDSLESILGISGSGEHSPAAALVPAGGQGDGAARNEGPDLVPAGSGDDADFRI